MEPLNPPTPHQKTCRYGHGALRVERGLWSLGGIKCAPDGAMDADPNLAFLLRIALCTTCGYVELFDSEDRP